MILEHRTYSFRPGAAAGWLQKYLSEGLPIQRQHLGRLIGIYATEIGLLHQVLLLWEYESLADREVRRSRMASDPSWQKYIQEVWDLNALTGQEVRILTPVAV